MKPFPRRTYHSIIEIWQDFLTIFAHRSLVRKAMRELISPSFRERLMMIVTQVNGCRFCNYYHAKASINSGVAIEELQIILKGQIPEDAPTEELPALIYAQHWAESNAHPDPVTVQKLVETYGQEKADAIHIVLRVIRVGNLLGNTLDAILYYISFGKWGNAFLKDSQT